ncbi:disease resistance protein RPV1 isoform X1 [Lactuca sativa]|uniref:disease resistance protein RPV1 isoform X1 n=1 Tax=Lactuca sativa TaxID=4236 RepID=UPI000CAD42E7|nr:disease resistance protein RPV1 isoform X1 [Lactuca sativa]
MAILTELQEEEAAAASSRRYHVFLSFRGKDTRLGFTDYLYEALVNENISTFRDEEEAEIGEELKPELARAIKSSRASIIVFSKNYASSTWCLDELVMILEQRKASNHIVIPVFYDIEPTHVRKQEGTIGEALSEHRQRIAAEKDEEKKIQGARKLEMWTKGLTEVADLIGKDANGRREMVVIEELVKEISSRLELHSECTIPHLIGMDISIDTISSWLKGGSSENAEVLTISGMGGIGKTSLAKYIYRLHYHEFERSSFVEDIERRCAGQTRALLDLQKQLLGDLLGKRMIEEHDVDVLTYKIEKALLNKQMLLVLDGVDNFEQVDVLIGTNGFLHPRSKIIITTKDGSLTEKCALFRMRVPPKHQKHALHGLSDSESLSLLCWHAFGGYDPKEGYENEAIRASKYCGGHPLALKLLGSSLNNEDVDTWRDTFEMLKTREFHTHVHVQKVLQISFDSLPSDNCKELFKHIACFFVGSDKEMIEAILKECGIRTSYGITKLIDRCLLTIGPLNELRMHQLLQEMGRDLVHQESPEKPWKRSRVWNHEESLYLLKEDKGTTKIQGLVLDMKMLEKESLGGSGSTVADSELQINDPNTIFGIGSSTHSILKFSSCCKKTELKTDALRKMDKLSLLQLNHVKFKGSYKYFPKGLRGLCMHGSKLKYIPSSLPMENLVALDMSYSDLTQLWKKPKLLGSLKILNLSYCKQLVRAGGFSGLPALERLILKRCECLVHVCESIGGCDSLLLLDLSYCRKLKMLPSSMIKLKNVQMLSLDGCAARIGKQSHASSSSSSVGEFVPKHPSILLISLPSSLVTLSLKHSNLSNESFPADFTSMSMLKKLLLDGNPIDSLPDCVRNLTRLERLSVMDCSKLKSVLCPPNTVKRLSADWCVSLVKITFSQEITAPPFVRYRYSVSLTEVQGVFKIQAIEKIDDQILCSLGWTHLQHVKDHKVRIWDSAIWSRATKLPVQMCYEFGIFSTCFPGNVVPEWLGHKNNGSSISFTMPSSSTNKRIEGINICFVHTFSGRGMVSSLRTKVRNITKDLTWIYYGYIFVVREADEDLVWLSHWMFGKNELEDGDEVSVTIVEEEEDGGIMVKECAVSPVYNDRENEEDPLSYYKSWKHIIGGDLSAFQLTSGDYFLTHDRFFNHPLAFKDLFQHKTTQNLFGYIPQYKGTTLILKYCSVSKIIF